MDEFNKALVGRVFDEIRNGHLQSAYLASRAVRDPEARGVLFIRCATFFLGLAGGAYANAQAISPDAATLAVCDEVTRIFREAASAGKITQELKNDRH